MKCANRLNMPYRMTVKPSLPFAVCNSKGVNLALNVYLQPKPVVQPAAKKEKV